MRGLLVLGPRRISPGARAIVTALDVCIVCIAQTQKFIDDI